MAEFVAKLKAYASLVGTGGAKLAFDAGFEGEAQGSEGEDGTDGNDDGGSFQGAGELEFFVGEGEAGDCGVHYEVERGEADHLGD